MNPRNGLCLNALHDRAFDRRLMFLDEDLKIRFHPRIKSRLDSESLKWLVGCEGQGIRLPQKFQPDVGLIKAHADTSLSQFLSHSVLNAADRRAMEHLTY